MEQTTTRVRPSGVQSPVLTEVTPTEAWRSTLVLDLDHPFFFDHPLDHVPGIMVISALLELVRVASADMDTSIDIDVECMPEIRRLRTALWFPRFCELDETTELRACPRSDAGGGWAVQATQPLGPICLGTVDVHDSGAPPRYPAPDGTAQPLVEPADGALVHRTRPENILVSRVTQDGDGTRRAAVLSSSDPDHFTRRSGAVRSPEEIIEAARQITVMAWPSEYGWPVDVLLTLNRMEADLPLTVDRDRPLELRWPPSQPRGAKVRKVLELFDRTVGPEPTGRITFDVAAWTPQEWQRLRARRQ